MPKLARNSQVALRSTRPKRRWKDEDSEDNTRPANRPRKIEHTSRHDQEETREDCVVRSQHPLHNAPTGSITRRNISQAGPSSADMESSECNRFKTAMRLLEQTTSILSEAAGYLSSSKDNIAYEARQKVRERWHKALPFHEEIHGALLRLSEALKLRHEELSAQHDKLFPLFKETLDLYEEMITKQARDTSITKSPDAYPYIHLLRTEYEQHQRESREPKPLGYIRYIYSPSVRIRQRLMDQINLCEESFDVVLAEQECEFRTARILSAATILDEWNPPSGLSKHVPLISGAIKLYRPCVCDQSHHQVRLSFSSSKDSDTLGAYNICLSTDSEVHIIATLHLLRAETLETTAKEKEPSAKQARFEESQHARCQAWDPCEGICEAFAKGPGKYALHANEANLQDLRCEVPRGPDFRLKSFREILQSGTLMRIEASKRAILGALLTYTYLFTVKTPFWDDSEEEPDFWFREEIRTREVDIGRIFLRYSDYTPVPSEAQNWPKVLNRERPSLPALGKLLFEVWQGTACTWDALINTQDNRKGENPLSHHWRLAIDNCLGKSDVLRDGGDIRQDPDLRSAFVNRVAKILQRMVEISEDRCFENVLTGGRKHIIAQEAASRGPNASYRPADGPSYHEDKLCLHDGEDQARTSITEDAKNADTWQRNLSGLYNELQSAPNAKPVKIAVLDTGVSFDNWALYQHKIAEQRSWVGVKDKISGAPFTRENIDTDGHGTYTTSVLMETSPSCEVYVAKVFEGRREKSGETPVEATQQAIANAILYAVETWEVNVITMSFGYANEVEIIGDAIETAARSNVAIFAAASNYGHNQQESWPARHSQVISIYAADGVGNKYSKNPTPKTGNDNFSVLGVEVSGCWKDGTKKRKSGTSVATPIAAGVATIFIEFMRGMKTDYLRLKGRRFSDIQYDDHVRRLTRYSKMRALFKKMTSEARDGYYPIEPSVLLDTALKEDKVFLALQILDCIAKA